MKGMLIQSQLSSFELKLFFPQQESLLLHQLKKLEFGKPLADCTLDVQRDVKCNCHTAVCFTQDKTRKSSTPARGGISIFITEWEWGLAARLHRNILNLWTETASSVLACWPFIRIFFWLKLRAFSLPLSTLPTSAMLQVQPTAKYVHA